MKDLTAAELSAGQVRPTDAPVRVAIIGGTGALGIGLAKRLSRTHAVLVGSRDAEKAKSAAAKVRGVTRRDVWGGVNLDAASKCDVAVVTIPYDSIGTILPPIANALAGKLAVSAVVPMVRRGKDFVYGLEKGSAAEEAAALLPNSEIAAAFHTLPARPLASESRIAGDVPVATDSDGAYARVGSLIAGTGLRPLRFGPLSSSRMLESLTPTLLNIALLNGMKNLTLKFADLEE